MFAVILCGHICYSVKLFSNSTSVCWFLSHANICICGYRMLNSNGLSESRCTHSLHVCESWPLAALIHSDRPGPGQTEQMPSRHTRLSARQHKTPPLAIQVHSCVLGQGFRRGNWHVNTQMHYTGKGKIWKACNRRNKNLTSLGNVCVFSYNTRTRQPWCSLQGAISFPTADAKTSHYESPF